LFDLT